jgi:signal transduction histidine kinase
VHPLFTHPVVLFIWTAGWSTAVLFAWLTLSTALGARSLGAGPRSVYVWFTALSCVHSVTIVLSLVPTSLPVKVAIFQAVWVLGTASLASWILAIRQFCGSTSQPILLLARGMLEVSAAAFVDLVMTPLVGRSLMFVPEGNAPVALALQVAGMYAPGSTYVATMGAVGVLLMLAACIALYRELFRTQSRDPFLYVGIAVTGLCTAVEVGLSVGNSPYNMPLVFIANLIEAFRITWVTHRRDAAEFERITLAKNQQAAVIESQLAELKTISRLAKVGENTTRLTHDMRNPLTVALGTLELLEDELGTRPQDPIEIERLVALTRQSLLHVSGLATRVTSQARPMAAEDPTDVSLTSVIDDAWSLNPPSSVRITNNVDPELHVVGRPTELTQVFVNLLSNATKAQDGAPDPWIIVDGERHNGTVRVRVRDGGHRPSPEQLDRMFRTQFTTAAEGEGTGLGLTICKHIVDEHEGDIWVDRESPNTSIVVELPAG